MSEFVASIGYGPDAALYGSIQVAVDSAKVNDVIVLIANTTENVVIPEDAVITLDLNGNTLSGGTDTNPENKDKPAILNNGTITIVDNSDSGTGMIKRDDIDVDSDSYYVINNQGTMTILGGTIFNDSGHADPEKKGGSSLICNGDEPDPEKTYEPDYAKLYIKGGKMHQDNFIAIKNGSKGMIKMTGGQIDSARESALQNWANATATGGTINGLVWAFAYDESGDSVTKLASNVTVNGKIWSQNYSESGTKKADIVIDGGTYNLTEDGKPGPAFNAKAGGSIAIYDGRFNVDPTPYLTDNSKITVGPDGNYTISASGVSIALLPKYPTHRLSKHAIFKEDDFASVIEVYTSRLIHYILNTCLVAIVKNDKFYPITINNCDEQHALVMSGKDPTVPEDPNFCILKLSSFVTPSITKDSRKVITETDIFVKSLHGVCHEVTDYQSLGIDAVTDNGFWLCINFDLDKAEAAGYSDIKFYGIDKAVVNGDNFILVNHDTIIGFTATYTDKDGNSDVLTNIFNNSLRFERDTIDIDPRA